MVFKACVVLVLNSSFVPGFLAQLVLKQFLDCKTDFREFNGCLTCLGSKIRYWRCCETCLDSSLEAIDILAISSSMLFSKCPFPYELFSFHSRMLPVFLPLCLFIKNLLIPFRLSSVSRVIGSVPFFFSDYWFALTFMHLLRFFAAFHDFLDDFIYSPCLLCCHLFAVELAVALNLNKSAFTCCWSTVLLAPAPNGTLFIEYVGGTVSPYSCMRIP